LIFQAVAPGRRKIGDRESKCEAETTVATSPLEFMALSMDTYDYER